MCSFSLQLKVMLCLATTFSEKQNINYKVVSRDWDHYLIVDVVTNLAVISVSTHCPLWHHKGIISTCIFWHSFHQVKQTMEIKDFSHVREENEFVFLLLFLKEYKNLKSEDEKKALLADLIVVQGEEKERRIGPEISARVYRNLTVQNPQLVLDWCCHETDRRHHWLLRRHCLQVETVPVIIVWTFYIKYKVNIKVLYIFK